MTFLAILLLAVQAAAGSLAISLKVEGVQELRATLSGPEAQLAPGAFHGTIALNGSAAEIPVSGTVAHANGRWLLPLTVKYADVPADWADRLQLQAVTYRLRGGVGGAVRDWTGTAPWKEIEVESARETGAEFLELQDVKLTQLSLLSSEAAAELTVRNPFGFPLKIVQAEYTIFVNGREVGEGSAQGLILHPVQKNALSLPIELDHGELLGAAGSALLSGGEIAATLRGKLVIRLKGGDVTVPLNLSGHLTDAS